jgi:hypothetical protein
MPVGWVVSVSSPPCRCDFDKARSDLTSRGLTVGAVQPGAQDVRFAAIDDPDGNRITLIENPVS